MYIGVHSFFEALFRGVAGLELAAQAVFENCKGGVDLNRVVLPPRLNYLPIDSVIDSVAYPVLTRLPTPCFHCHPPSPFSFLLPTPFSCMYRGPRATFNRRRHPDIQTSKLQSKKGPQRLEMVLCKFFVSGSCKRGENCHYSHETTNSNANPLQSTQPVSQNSLAFRIRGSDPAHPTQDPRSQIPCFYYAQGNCRNGSACPYSHLEGSEQEVEATSDPEVRPLQTILVIS